jgi:hypothetical protein
LPFKTLSPSTTKRSRSNGFFALNNKVLRTPEKGQDMPMFENANLEGPDGRGTAMFLCRPVDRPSCCQSHAKDPESKYVNLIDLTPPTHGRYGSAPAPTRKSAETSTFRDFQVISDSNSGEGRLWTTYSAPPQSHPLTQAGTQMLRKNRMPPPAMVFNVSLGYINSSCNAQACKLTHKVAPVLLCLVSSFLSTNVSRRKQCDSVCSLP